MKYRFKPDTKDKAASGGGGVRPGVYDMRVTACELTETTRKDPQWKVGLTVEKAHTDEASPAGSTHADWITWTEAAEWRAWIFLEACGVGPEKLDEFDLASTELVVGRTVRVTVEPHRYTAKDGEERETSKVGARGYAPIADAAPPAQSTPSADPDGDIPF